MKISVTLLTACAVVLLGSTAGAQDAEKKDVPEVLNFTMKSIDGQNVDLSDYKGKVVVFVNVASKCGLTPQYEGLQTLHKKYSDQGLAILGFPCNQFGGQEPGSEPEIKQFCQRNYGVEFDMFSKIDVNGDDKTELYAHLTALDTEPEGAGDISWNFEKFVVDRNGKVIARFGPRVKPESDEFVEFIEKALNEK